MKDVLIAVAWFVMLAGGSLQNVYAQQPPSEAPQGPAHVVTYIEVVSGMSGKATVLLRTARAASRKAPSVLRYEILQRRERPNAARDIVNSLLQLT